MHENIFYLILKLKFDFQQNSIADLFSFLQGTKVLPPYYLHTKSAILQAMVTKKQTGASWSGLRSRQGQVVGEQEAQRQESSTEGLRESHPPQV